MEWKREWNEKIFVGVITFLGGIFVKKARPTWNQLKRLANSSDDIDRIRREILELKKNNELTNERLEKLMYTSENPIFITNNEGEVISVNLAYLEMTGIRTYKDALGIGYMQAIPHSNRDYMKEQMELFAEHPSSFIDQLVFQHISNGNIIVTKCRSEPILFDDELFETIWRLTIIKP